MSYSGIQGSFNAPATREQITSTRTTARQMQFALKFIF